MAALHASEKAWMICSWRGSNEELDEAGVLEGDWRERDRAGDVSQSGGTGATPA